MEIFIAAFFLGLIFNAAPGAILAESLRRGLKGGFYPAMSVQIGSLVGDLLWVILGLAGAATLVTIPFVKIPLVIIGIIMLLYFSWGSFRDAVSVTPNLSFLENSPTQNRNALISGVAISVSNPMNVTYWAALSGTIAAISGDTPTTEHFIIFVGGFMLSSILWCFVASILISWTRKNLNVFIWRTLNLSCSIGLMVFALIIINELMEII